MSTLRDRADEFLKIAKDKRILIELIGSNEEIEVYEIQGCSVIATFYPDGLTSFQMLTIIRGGGEFDNLECGSRIEKAILKTNSKLAYGRFRIIQEDNYWSVFFQLRIGTNSTYEFLPEMLNSVSDGYQELRADLKEDIYSLWLEPLYVSSKYILRGMQERSSSKIKIGIDLLIFCLSNEAKDNSKAWSSLGMAYLELANDPSLKDNRELKEYRTHFAALALDNSIALEESPISHYYLGLAHMQLGEINYAEGARDEAEYEYKQAIRNFQMSLGRTDIEAKVLDRLGTAHSKLGRLLSERGAWAGAESHIMLGICYLEKALSLGDLKSMIYPTIGLAYSDLGRICIERGDLDRAEKELKQSVYFLEEFLSTDKSDASVLHNVGSSYVEIARVQRHRAGMSSALDSIGQGILNLKRSLEVRGEHMETLHDLGVALADFGRMFSAEGDEVRAQDFFNQSIPYLQRVVEIRNDIPKYFRNLGGALLGAHRYTDALYPLSRAAELFSKTGQVFDELLAVVDVVTCLEKCSPSQLLALFKKECDWESKIATIPYFSESQLFIRNLPEPWRIRFLIVALLGILLAKHYRQKEAMLSRISCLDRPAEAIALSRMCLNIYRELKANDWLQFSQFIAGTKKMDTVCPERLQNLLSTFMNNAPSLLQELIQACLDRAKTFTKSYLPYIISEQLQVELYSIEGKYVSAKLATTNGLRFMRQNRMYSAHPTYRLWFIAAGMLMKFLESGSVTVLKKIEAIGEAAWRVGFRWESMLFSIWATNGYLVKREYRHGIECSERRLRKVMGFLRQEGPEVRLGLFAQIDKLRRSGLEALCRRGGSELEKIELSERYRSKWTGNIREPEEAVIKLAKPTDDVYLYCLSRLHAIERIVMGKNECRSLGYISVLELHSLVLEWLNYIEECQALPPGERLPEVPVVLLTRLSSMLLEGIQLEKGQSLKIIPSDILPLFPFSLLVKGENRVIENNPIEKLPGLNIHRSTKNQHNGRTLWMALADYNGRYVPLGLDIISSKNPLDTFVFGNSDVPPDIGVLFEESNWKRSILSAHGKFDPLNPLEAHIRLPNDNRLYGFANKNGISVPELKFRTEELCLLACLSGATENCPGEEFIGMIRGWMSLGIKTIVSCYWQIPAPAAAYVILRLNDFSNLGLSESINKIQVEMLSGNLEENGFTYLIDNSVDLFGWRAPANWIRKQLRHPYYWGGLGVWRLPS